MSSEKTSGLAAGRGAGFARAAEAMLHSLGGSEIVLRFSLDGTDDVALEPAAVRVDAETTNHRSGAEFVVAASCIQQQIAERLADSVEVLLNRAEGILYDDQLFQIKAVQTERFSGIPYLYRILAIHPEEQI